MGLIRSNFNVKEGLAVYWEVSVFPELLLKELPAWYCGSPVAEKFKVGYLLEILLFWLNSEEITNSFKDLSSLLFWEIIFFITE